MKPIIVVSRMSSTARPSTPRKYSAPIVGIQGTRSTNWKSAPDGWYQNQSGTDTAKPMSATMFAIHRIAFSFRLLTNSRSTAPASGVKRMIESKCWFISPHEQIDADEREDADEHPHRVVLHEARLQLAEPEAAFFADAADEVDDAVHDRAIRQAREPGADDREPAAAVDGAINDVAIERPEPSAGRERA